MQSQHAHIDWAAAKRIVVSVAGGASMTMEGGNITFECPGTITVRAGKKSFVGPSTAAQEMNKMPGELPADEEFVLRWPQDDSPVRGRAFEVLRGDGTVIRGVTDAQGGTGLQKSQIAEALQITLRPEA